jgi:hypothetical protein
MQIPKDPYMLLSWVNMKLRDSYPSLEALADSELESEDELSEKIIKKLESAGYFYDSTHNQFVQKG